MKGLICYYSGSGNTKLACHYLARHVPVAQWIFCDIVRDQTPDLNVFDVVGFACFTDFWGVPQRMIQFMQALPDQKNRIAFTLTTYGMIGVFSLRDLSRLARGRGMRVIEGFALHTPENYPPMICAGLGNKQAPNPKERKKFSAFLSRLNSNLKAASEKRAIRSRSPGENILFWMRALKRTHARSDMGKKFVDQALCTKCRICEKGCPYHAIALEPYPTFNMKTCYGCWACYNHCPEQAIYTAKFRGRGHYSQPTKPYAEKMA